MTHGASYWDRNLHGEPWRQVKTALENRYSHLHSTKRGAHAKFIFRCRKLKDVRDDLGLKYVIFFPKLSGWSEGSSTDDWQKCKKELAQGGVLSKLDEMILHHCPEWLDLLQKMFPRWDLQLFPPGQQLNRSQEGNRTDAEYDVPS